MRYILCLISLLSIFSSSVADDCCRPKFYLKLGSGGSCSAKANVCAPTRIWDPAQQGYNAKLGNTGIFEVGIGSDIFDWLTADLTYSYRPRFEYIKFQRGIPSTVVPTFLGDKTRYFALDAATFMATGYLNGYGFCEYSYIPCAAGYIQPIIGLGAGVSQLVIYNFRSVGLAPVVSTIPSFGSHNPYTVRYQFTYQVVAGFEYKCPEAWALSSGYRWFSTTKFRGPSFISTPQGQTEDIRGYEWRQKLRAHEFFIEAKLYF